MSATTGTGVTATPDLWSRLGAGVEKITADPIFKLGMSLMARGGPSARPHSFGQDLAGSFNDLTDSQRKSREDKLKEMELEDYTDARGRRKKWGEEMDKAYPSLLQTLMGEIQPQAQPNLMPQPQPMQPSSSQPSDVTQATAPGPAPVQTRPLAPPQPQFTQGGMGGLQGVADDLSPDYMKKLAMAESSGNPNAQASTSSAKGLFGFTDGTYKMFADNPADFSPEAQAKAAERFTQANVGHLRMNNLPVNDANAYMMHFFGSKDGPKFLKASDDTPVANVVQKTSIDANAGLLGGKTVGQVKQIFAEKMGAEAAPQAAAPIAALTSTPAETLQDVMGLPAKQKKQILLGAMLASQGDPDKFMAHVGQSMLQLAEAKARKEEDNPNAAVTEFNTSDGRVIARTKGGSYIDVTDKIGGPKLGTKSTQDIDIEKMTPDVARLVKGGAAQFNLIGPSALPTGQGNAGLRKAMMAQAFKDLEERGMSPGSAIVTRTSVDADRKSMANLTKQADAFQSFENKLLLDMKRVETLMPKGGMGPSAIPLLDSYVQHGRDRLLGDPSVPGYNAALITVIDEYAKIMSGSTGNTPTSDAARAQIAEMLRADMNSGQVGKVFETIRVDAHNRQQATLQQKGFIQDRIAAYENTSSTDDQKKALGAGLDKIQDTTKTGPNAIKPKKWKLLNGKLVPDE